MRRGFIALLMLLMWTSSLATAQVESRTDYAWTPIIEQEGLAISYIYYGAGENRGGIVLRLRNRNEHPVDYRFVVMVRARGAEFVEEVTGTIGALADKTGDAAGLFWEPFDPNLNISEIGLRGLRVRQQTRR